MATAQINSEEIGDEAKKAKIQAAQELVEKSKQLGSALNGLLGKKQTDTLTNLIDYVGANGRYVSITKQVTSTAHLTIYGEYVLLTRRDSTIPLSHVRNGRKSF